MLLGSRLNNWKAINLDIKKSSKHIFLRKVFLRFSQTGFLVLFKISTEKKLNNDAIRWIMKNWEMVQSMGVCFKVVFMLHVVVVLNLLGVLYVQDNTLLIAL